MEGGARPQGGVVVSGDGGESELLGTGSDGPAVHDQGALPEDVKAVRGRCGTAEEAGPVSGGSRESGPEVFEIEDYAKLGGGIWGQ